ncbi:MAG: retropepsin-like aspartic protease [Candidatus Omnitrophica bacterium]|jgi:aspartyl protease family protein|nr:retropepsin-like aspartic protease [Candidatus Omnitrophota bacterium]MDD5655436.1 retropepsin-like aspartic protease [Candidatus Omnitrophota bacterium]
MKYVYSLCALFFLFVCPVQSISADIVYLKNGRSIEGVIKSEDAEGLKLDIGLGTVGIGINEIDRIDRASSGADELRNKWDQEKQAREAKDAQEGTTQKSPQDPPSTGLKRPKEVDVTREGNHVFVEAVLNKQVKAQLLVDTGASIIVLSNEMAKKLDIDMSNIRKKDMIHLQMGDGRKVAARFVSLKTVSIEGVEAKGVDAAILPDSETEPDFKDGLLGMSFLKRFSFRMDLNDKKLILEPLK